MCRTWMDGLSWGLDMERSFGRVERGGGPGWSRREGQVAWDVKGRDGGWEGGGDGWCFGRDGEDGDGKGA